MKWIASLIAAFMLMSLPTHIAFASGGGISVPQSPGTKSYEGNGATLDVSNAEEGYITAMYCGDSPARLRVSDPTGRVYTYNLRTDGEYESFPLTGGNGRYTLEVWQNRRDNQYMSAVAATVNVELESELSPFLCPSQYVSFDERSVSVAKSRELAAGAADTFDFVSRVYEYVTENIIHDDYRAQQAAAGKLAWYAPDADGALSGKKGISFDSAALMTAMLRAQQIPAKMEYAHAGDGAYRIRISIHTQDTGWTGGVIQFDGKSWSKTDPASAPQNDTDFENGYIF